MTPEWLGRLGYADAVDALESHRAAVLNSEAPPRLLLCEHPPTITLGKSARDTDVVASAAHLAKAGVAVVRSSRGGDVTYHGPGQLMIYPIVRLRRGIVPLLSSLGTELARIAAALGVEGAQFRRDPVGVWVGDRKVAACGIHVRRRVMIHGFSLDLRTPAQAWLNIVPCGMRERPTASLRELGGQSVSAADAAARFGDDLARAVAAGASIALP